MSDAYFPCIARESAQGVRYERLKQLPESSMGDCLGWLLERGFVEQVYDRDTDTWSTPGYGKIYFACTPEQSVPG